MNLPLRAGALALPALALACPAALADDPSVDAFLSEPIYEIGDTLELTITGPPGGWLFLVFSRRRDSVSIPGIGDFGVSFDPWPVILDVGLLPPTGSITLHDTTLCSRLPGADVPLFVQPAILPPGTWLPACTPDPVALIRANGAHCPRCMDEPETDPSVSSQLDGFALSLPGTGGAFTMDAATDFQERKDGTATLKTLFRSSIDPTRGFVGEIALSGRLDCIDAGFPPVGSPALKLDASAFFENGGPIDTAAWHYYSQLHGTLVGFGAYDGAVVELSPSGAVQVGPGADGRNLGYGLCASVDADVVKQPSSGPSLADTTGGEFVVSEAVCTGDTVCVTSSRVGDHAFWLPDFPQDVEWMFEGGPGEFTEYPDGTATLFGRIVNEADADLCFDVFGVFSGRLDAGDSGFPPAGSPKFGDVGPENLVENGGVVDPDTWHYYLETNIVLVGCRDLDGALVHATRKGPAFQVGVGANFHDTDLGASGWLYTTVLQQSTNGPWLTKHGEGDINFDIVECPERDDAPIAHYDFATQAGDVVYDVRNGFDMAFDKVDGDLVWIQEGGRSGLHFEQGASVDTCLRRPNGTDAAWLLDRIQAGQAFSVQVLMRQQQTTANYARIVTFSSSTSLSDRNFSLMGYPENGGLHGHVRVTAQKGTYDHEFTAPWSAGELVVYTLSYDGLGDQQVHVYADGVEILRETHGGDLRDWTLRPFTIGNEHGGNRPFRGDLFDVKLWNRPLSADEVAAEAAALLGN
ncbi:MAG: LamG-like jellyroll fold domain-containing protein [Planctomycetota bacterium]